MSFEEFQISLSDNQPPEGLSSLLLALWYDAKGDWNMSHDIASDINTNDGSLLHAYLHRKEGDLWNADYWYKRAGINKFECSLEEEWKHLVEKFIA